MRNSLLIYPMATLLLLTMTMLLLMLVFRIKAVRLRKISPRYYKLYKGGEEPEQLAAISQNYQNLLELTLLFYVVCILVMILNLEVKVFVIHAWIYVALRYFHSLIHITYNNILHRLAVFAVSCLVLISMWINLVIKLS